MSQNTNRLFSPCNCHTTPIAVSPFDDCEKNAVSPLENPIVQVPVVIARARKQKLVQAEVPFPPQFPATEIVQVIKKVRDLSVTPCSNKAIINGVLDVNVIYKTVEGDYNYRMHGEDPTATFGDVRQIGFNVPFSDFVEAPGAKAGDNVIVNFAGVENDCEVDTLTDPIDSHCPKQAYCKLQLSTIILLDVSITRDVLIPLGNYPIFPGNAADNEA